MPSLTGLQKSKAAVAVPVAKQQQAPAASAPKGATALPKVKAVKSISTAPLPTGLLWPVPGAGKINQLPFDSYSHRNSNALDISAIVGTPVIAPAGGAIRRITSDVGYGNHVIIDSDYGQIYLAHLSSFVGTGATVKAGELIGYSGSTGNSDGPHVHYEIRNSTIGNLSSLLGGADIGAQTIATRPPTASASILSSVASGLVAAVTPKGSQPAITNVSSISNAPTGSISGTAGVKSEPTKITVATTPAGDIKIPVPGKTVGRFVLIGVGILLMVAALVKWTTGSKTVTEGVSKIAQGAAVKAASGGIL